MRAQSKRFYPALLLIFAMLACSLPVATPAPPAATQLDATKIALEIQSTQMALQLTQVSVQNTQQAVSQPVADTPAPPQPTHTEPVETPPTQAPPPTDTETVPIVTPTTEDKELAFQKWLPKAKILIYEDTPNIGLWVREAVDGLGLEYVHVGDAVGTFMENLNSGIDWDLIIVGAESKTKVQGEFWDVISEKAVRKKTALIAEVWYLDSTASGRVQPFMSQCGIRYQRDWPLAESIYWLKSDDPVFNEPNTAMPLIHYNRYWNNQAGDLIKLSPGSEAKLLAGLFQKEKSTYGLIASCFEGRVIFQTFSNHDYRHDEILNLWQNYVYYTLKNHYMAAHSE